MKIFQSRNINDYKPILEGLVEDWGYIYWSSILKWCNIINNPIDGKYWEVWIIEYENKIIGICGLWSQKANSIEELWLGWFGLIPEMRNKKIGNDIIKFMENEAKRLGTKKILSYVDKDGKPLNFYFKNGYERICSVREYLKKNPTALENDFQDKDDHIISKLLTFTEIEITNMQKDNLKNETSTDANNILTKGLPIDNIIHIDIKKFIIWLFHKDEWHYDSTENLWKQDGYGSKTIDELYLYYQTK